MALRNPSENRVDIIDLSSYPPAISFECPPIKKVVYLDSSKIVLQMEDALEIFDYQKRANILKMKVPEDAEIKVESNKLFCFSDHILSVYDLTNGQWVVTLSEVGNYKFIDKIVVCSNVTSTNLHFCNLVSREEKTVPFAPDKTVSTWSVLNGEVYVYYDNSLNFCRLPIPLS